MLEISNSLCPSLTRLLICRGCPKLGVTWLVVLQSRFPCLALLALKKEALKTTHQSWRWCRTFEFTYFKMRFSCWELDLKRDDLADVGNLSTFNKFLLNNRSAPHWGARGTLRCIFYPLLPLATQLIQENIRPSSDIRHKENKKN